MTLSIAGLPTPIERQVANQAGKSGLSPAILIAVGSLISFALSWPHLTDLWLSRTFFDTDDAMRMVEVRAWLAGQGWFDLTVHRLDPPSGVFMHWSRVVDLPLGALIRVFEIFEPMARAELLARLVFPLALQTALIAATIFTGRVLAGPGAALPAMLLATMSGMQFGQFTAGRIDHHAPQITLHMLTAGLAADVMLNARIRSAILAAICMAVSLAISLENAPFIAVMLGALALTWAVRGETHGPALRAFGLALAAASAAAYVTLIPQSRYGFVSSDAFSLPHLLTCALGGLAMALLTASAIRLDTKARRLAAGLSFGTFVAAVVVAVCPGVLSSPYSQIDPVVRAVWLAHVTEATPLTAAVQLHPQAATLIVAPLMAGLVALGLAAARSRQLLRGAWLLVAALTLVGLAGSLWEVRIVSSTTPLALLGGVWAFTAASKVRSNDSRWLPSLRAGLLLFVFSPVAWVIVPVPDEMAETALSTKAAESCRQADHVRPLAQLGSGIIFAPIDSGSHLLVHTALSVLGAPYHRNNAGNRVVIDGFSAEGPEAERIVKGTGASYVAICPGQVQAAALTARNPNGLAAKLVANDPPSWLEPLHLAGTPYHVFAVR